jgi:PKD repeat protein
VNVYPTWGGAASGCNPNFGSCITSETLTFAPASYSYSFACGTHTFTWDFGDGTPTKTGDSVTHQYSTAGTYPLKMFVSVNGGSPITTSASVVIKGGSGGTGQINVDFSIAPMPGVPNGYIFTPTTTNGTVPSWSWSFGDGDSGTSTGLAPKQHVYPDGTNYKVTLTPVGVTNANIVSKFLRDPNAVPPKRRSAGH